MAKPRIATVSLCGCFGCHMSLLDIDEHLLDLAERVEFGRTPLNDIKNVENCAVGLIEGGVANAENVEVLRAFREQCDILVGVGACAVNGGIPAMRNPLELDECLSSVYLDGIGVDNPMIPQDAEIPPLLDKVRPVHEVVKIDYFLPGCPPSADSFWRLLTQLLDGAAVEFELRQIHYD